MSNFTFQILHSKERQLLDEIAGVGKFHERHFRFLKSHFSEDIPHLTLLPM
jgi:hypothetical protein